MSLNTFFSFVKTFSFASKQNAVSGISIRSVWDTRHLVLPDGRRGNFRRTVHFPEKYTVKPLDNTHLGGRDPYTRRVIVATLGGGLKHKYHWVDRIRDGPSENVPPKKEKVIQIIKSGCRTADVALVGDGNRLKYILATANMKAGDIIQTSRYIPTNAVFPNEGDAYPLGALPTGTLVNSVEKYPGKGSSYSQAAGTCAKILRKINDRVIIKLSSKAEVSLPETCMATVGQISNVEHGATPIGSANKLRELGRRPRSGLWHRKGGRFGRKIKPPRPPKVVTLKEKEERKTIQLVHPDLAMNYW